MYGRCAVWVVDVSYFWALNRSIGDEPMSVSHMFIVVRGKVLTYSFCVVTIPYCVWTVGRSQGGYRGHGFLGSANRGRLGPPNMSLRHLFAEVDACLLKDNLLLPL